MKKPTVPETMGAATASYVEAVRANVEVITGRRGERALGSLDTLRISDPPTQDEVEMLRAALVTLIRRLEE